MIYLVVYLRKLGNALTVFKGYKMNLRSITLWSIALIAGIALAHWVYPLLGVVFALALAFIDKRLSNNQSTRNEKINIAQSDEKSKAIIDDLQEIGISI